MNTYFNYQGVRFHEFAASVLGCDLLRLEGLLPLLLTKLLSLLLSYKIIFSKFLIDEIPRNYHRKSANSSLEKKSCKPNYLFLPGGLLLPGEGDEEDGGVQAGGGRVEDRRGEGQAGLGQGDEVQGLVPYTHQVRVIR